MTWPDVSPSWITGPCLLDLISSVSTSSHPLTFIYSTLFLNDLNCSPTWYSLGLSGFSRSIYSSVISIAAAVKAQAIFPLCPMAKRGIPGVVTPIAPRPPSFVCTPTTYQNWGRRLSSRCGSLANKAFPDLLFLPDIAQAFEDSVIRNGVLFPAKR